ncbi:hypothetical protein [Microbacterium sp.]|jgi:hypothetical protein|uniref:hypothetical protein n=1 Tax=Microbacterium sp. TaxID=51671 RepID=UPI0037C65795
MTEDEAAAACLATHDDPAVTVTGPARVEARSVEPEWMVIFPASNVNGPMNIVCIVGGDPSAPSFLVTLNTMLLSEEDIQRDLTSNSAYETSSMSSSR